MYTYVAYMHHIGSFRMGYDAPPDPLVGGGEGIPLAHSPPRSTPSASRGPLNTKSWLYTPVVTARFYNAVDRAYGACVYVSMCSYGRCRAGNAESSNS